MKRNIVKKVLTTILAAGMMLSLAACGSSTPANTVHSVEDMAGKTIGVQLGTTGDIFASDFVDENEGTKLEQYSKAADAVQSLKQGKIDCVIIDRQPAETFVAKNDDLMILEEEFAVEDYAIAVAKENKELTEKINGALAEIKADGTLDTIISNYIGDDTKGKNAYVSPENVDRSNGTLIMATNAAFEPYEYYSGEDIVGIDVDMAKAVCDRIGMELKIEDMEFDSIINAVQSGKADVGIAGMTVTEDRLENVDFTESYATSKQVIVVRKK